MNFRDTLQKSRIITFSEVIDREVDFRRSKTLRNYMLMAMAASPSWTSETTEILQLAADSGV